PLVGERRADGEAAIAAAAADGLSQDAVRQRAVGQNRAGAGDRDVLAHSAAPAVAAHGFRRDRGDDRVVRAGDQQGEAAVAAASADALGYDAARIRLRRRKRAAEDARRDIADAFHVDGAGRIAGPAVAAHASRRADAAILQGQSAAEAAI